MYPTKVFYEDSKTRLANSKQEVFSSNKSLGLGKLFISSTVGHTLESIGISGTIKNGESKFQNDSLKIAEIYENAQEDEKSSDDTDTDSDSNSGASSDSDSDKTDSNVSTDTTSSTTTQNDSSKHGINSNDEAKIRHLHGEAGDALKKDLGSKKMKKKRQKKLKPIKLKAPDNTTLSDFIRQLQEDDTSSVRSKDSFFADLRSLLSISSEEQKTILKSYQQEQSIFSMADLDDCWCAWNYNNHPEKLNLASSLEYHYNNHLNVNTIRVSFGRIHFKCHKLILRHAKLFRTWERKDYKFKAEHQVSAIAFTIFYQFAMGKKPEVAAKYFLSVLRAAEILDVPTFKQHCMRTLDSPLYHESTAFEIYKAAKQQTCFVIQRLMMQRLWKFFMPLVATKYFADMDVDDVCQFLEADTIGVNSEIEIFFAAILWLSTKWTKRKGKTIVKVMSCVRYGLMPPWFTYSLKNGTGFQEVDRILENKNVVKMIDDGASIAATISLYFMEPSKFENILQRLLPKIPKQRKWVFDKNCTYHYGAHEKVSEAVDFIVFKDYLKMLQLEGQNCWHNFQEAKEDHLVHIFCQKFSDPAWSKMKF